MYVKKSINLVEIVIDEVALEGLDGITLEALWQRLAIRLGDSLPLKTSFMEQIWKICLELPDFFYYELENPREKLIIYDLYELEYLNSNTQEECIGKDIYPHCPVEDTKLDIRGSCSTYYTRKNISDIVKNSTLEEVNNKYGQKLVIVASQTLRENALIEDNANPILKLQIAHYCLLERIGRARSIGEITIKKNKNIKEDVKALFYIRKGLQQHGLIRKQIYHQGITGGNYTGQNTGTLIHLTRFFNIRKPKVIQWAEHLIKYLKSKENYAAEYGEVKNELNLEYSIKKFFKMNFVQKIFRTDLKVPYRSYYPNSTEKEWQIKSNSKEKIIKLVTLINPNIDTNDIWRTEEVNEDDDHCQLDVSKQKINVPFLKQIYKALESKEFKGATQTELAIELGFTKLIGRTLVRNLVKANVVSTYLDDIGRQRTTKFVSKKFEAKSSLKKQFEEEISKIKEYSKSIPNDKVESQNNKVESQSDNNLNTEKVEQCNMKVEEKITEFDDKITDSELDTTSVENLNNENVKEELLTKANHLLWKYKLCKNKNKYQYTSSQKNNKIPSDNSKRNENEDINEKVPSTSQNICHNSDAAIIDSDFYKTVEAKLIVQKPECKKKSQKVAVTGFMKNVDNSGSNKQSSISYRLLRRANLVIESVKKHKIIDDTQKLMKYINKEEDKEGLDVKIDKNSLIRLLQKLAEDNFIKYIKLILKNKKQTKQKIINFICDPSIDVNDAVIQSAVEQAKLKFCLTEAHLDKSTESIENSFESGNTNTCNTQKMEKNIVIVRNDVLGKKYGYSPKFIRMKTMHIFLYYLIYDHPGHYMPRDAALNYFRKQEFFSDDLFENYTAVYDTDINWKMFIPPLPKHRGYPKGWGFMCDILLRTPLSLFVKFHNINFEVPGLQELLDHPIKRHFLVKDLPTSIRNMLYIKRKYMFSIHEVVTRLCYVGLVQFGPQMLKEKDQVFIYLNRHTELLDTTSSAAGYHRIEDKPYPVNKFTFTSMEVVENYWYEMWNTCINTCLGGRTVVEGKDILLEDLSRKAEMIQALKVRTADEAEKYDTGFVPGDRKGAAGIDSAFFSHLKRNWNWVNSNPKDVEKKDVIRPAAPIKIPKTNVKFSSIQSRKIPSPKKQSTPLKQINVKVRVAGIVSSGINNKIADSIKSSPTINQRKESTNQPRAMSSGKPSKIIRKVLPRKPKRKRVKYDEVDFSALQRMDKLRVDWEQHEDNILLVCKVAMVYLYPNPRRNLVSFTAIRDILRSYSYTSYNKTSRACQRRLLYMLKQQKTFNSVMLGVEEVKQDYYVNKRFGAMVNRGRSENEDPVEYEKKVEKVFKELVTYIAKKYYNISNMETREPVVLPKTIQEFNIFYKLKLPTKTIRSPSISKEVREVNDIHTATINSVIHSSMCCGKERRSWAYQLFKVYQQYPEYLLKSAMLKIRADQMVTMKKNYMSAYKKFGNCMPMSSSQYQLSSAYFYKFQTKWPYEVFSESYNVLLSLFENYAARLQQPIDGIEVKSSIGGIVAAMHDFIGSENMEIDIDIPDQIIMLDPALPEKDEVYQRIALRYQAILKSLSSDYTEQLKSSTNDTKESNDTIPLVESNIEQIPVSNEQQSFFEIRSVKRPFEYDCSFSPSKKRKLNNADDRFEVEKENEKCEAEINKINEDIEPIIDSKLSEIGNNLSKKFCSNQSLDDIKDGKNDQSLKDNKNFCDKSLNKDNPSNNSSETNCLNTQSISNELLDNKTNGEQEESNSVNILTFSNCSDIQLISNEQLNHKNNEEQEESNNVSILTSSELLNKNDSATNGNVETEKLTSVRVSDLVKCANSKDAIENLEMRSDVHDVRTRQTRIAMLKMREELHDLTFHDSHHAHEYFVVNSFKLFCSLIASNEEKKVLVSYRGMELPKKLMPIDIEVANGVLEDVKKFAVFPKSPMSYDEFKEKIVKKNLYNWDDVDSIYKFIKTKIEFGATLYELVKNFDYLNDKLAEILQLLSTNRIVLRAGIITVRYIHFRYVNPWIIHSYKILRLEKESHQTVPEGSVYVLDNEDSGGDRERETNKVFTAANLFYNSSIATDTNESSQKEINLREESLQNSPNKSKGDNVDNNLETQANNETPNEVINLDENDSQKSKVDSADNADGDASNQKRLRRNRTVLIKQKDVYRAAKLLDFNTAEEIKVVIKPWIRIDGVVNRRVLDRMLGAVLCYCIERPGISLTIIQNRFTPAIQPYHTRELMEILVKLNCVKMIVQSIPKVTLFSKPAKLDFTGNPDLIADSDSIVIEPTIEASLRFGVFLSNRSYNLDFLSTL